MAVVRLSLPSRAGRYSALWLLICLTRDGSGKYLSRAGVVDSAPLLWTPRRSTMGIHCGHLGPSRHFTLNLSFFLFFLISPFLDFNPLFNKHQRGSMHKYLGTSVPSLLGLRRLPSGSMWWKLGLCSMKHLIYPLIHGTT